MPLINDITSAIDGQLSSAGDSQIHDKSPLNVEFMGVFPGALNVYKNDDK
jgi:hypothetical protein